MGTVMSVLLIILLALVLVQLFLIKELLGRIKESLSSLYELTRTIGTDESRQLTDIQFAMVSAIEGMRFGLESKLGDVAYRIDDGNN